MSKQAPAIQASAVPTIAPPEQAAQSGISGVKQYGFGGTNNVPAMPKPKDPTKPVRGGPPAVPMTFPKMNLPDPDIRPAADKKSAASDSGDSNQSNSDNKGPAVDGIAHMPAKSMTNMAMPKMPTPAQINAAAPSLQVPASPFETPKPEKSGFFGGAAKPASPSPAAPPQAEEKSKSVFSPLSIVLLIALVAGVFFFGKKRG